jgi:DNA-binding transcriptional regulator YdaS (Cro superfamily)|tara:strand:+ start:307 stop:522 length:216 start_codon:yes stop_codon:yes gene_type:complete
MANSYKLAVERKREVVNTYGGKKLSKMLGISHPAVSKWKVIPPFRAYQIAKLGDFDIEYIRPDLRLDIIHK